MADSDELIKAFSGLGVDEKALISILGNWNPDKRQFFRNERQDFFTQDERRFQRWDDRRVLQLRHEFLRLKEAIVLWTMHPWERDARMLKDALLKGPQNRVLIEIACTRSSEELLGARRAYHSLFHFSIEEDVAFHIQSVEKKILVALLSSYRYEGPKVSEDIAKKEARTLFNAIKRESSEKELIEDEELVKILSTRSKLHLKEVYKHYKEISGQCMYEVILSLIPEEDLDGDLLVKEVVQCLCTPPTYFSDVLNASLGRSANEVTKEAVTRIIVTRADEDMNQIVEEYHNKYGLSLSEKIEGVANGNYRDFLLTLIARGVSQFQVKLEEV